MNASALARSPSASTLIGRTTTGWPWVCVCSWANVGISATQGAQKVPQRLTTSALPLNSARVCVLPAASVKGACGAGVGAASTLSPFISPTARLLRSPPGGLEEQPGMTYRAAATAARAKTPVRLPYLPTIRRLMPPKSDQPAEHAAGHAHGPSQGHSLWGGRFSAKPDALMQAINVSIGFDRRLAAQDLAGSKAHAAMLAAQGIISLEDAQAIQRGLATIEAEIEAGTFPFREEFEDIHFNVEQRLTELIGEAAGRLHTARSRNDQVALDFRLWVRAACDRSLDQILGLQRALLAKAEAHAATLAPGFTHLQSAQPVTFGHHLMAYVEMLARDAGRFIDARKRLNECPLGAAALAGTSFPIDRQATARTLGFDRPMANSLDAVSARDFALEALAAAGLTALNLSRLAEEIVLWTTPQFGFIRLSDAFTTGSSIMPQKRNPDAAELTRAKTGRVR